MTGWLLLLASLFFCVLAFVANEQEQENAYTKKSLAFLTVAGFLLVGFGFTVGKNYVFLIPFFTCLIALIVYRYVV